MKYTEDSFGDPRFVAELFFVGNWGLEIEEKLGLFLTRAGKVTN